MDTSYTTVTIIFLLMVLMYPTLLNTTLGEQKFNNKIIESQLPAVRPPPGNVSANAHLQNDTVRPLIKISNPGYPPTITTGKIVIEGTASDSESGIHNISAAAHIFPFQGTFPIHLGSQPIQSIQNSKLYWSVPLVINTTGTYRVVIEARDNAGNVNYAETTINAALAEDKLIPTTKTSVPKISFVQPTFTEAAYQEHGFYRFYFKYGFPPFGKNITTDLDMLTVKTPRSISEFVDENELRHLSNITALVPIKGTELSDVSQDPFPYPQKFWLPFIENVRKVAPNAILTVMRDEDVHDGHIFRSDNKSNAYDILLLFHNEYVTQQEYNNLRQFVSNGGTIVFIDANALYAEVRYDRSNHSITLVKGHDWEFDGKAAKRSVPERWYNETKEWVGSNYLQDHIKNKVTFTNNPFNYTHFEEQYINNGNAQIIINYGIKFPASGYFKDPSLFKKQVASYILHSGKGKVLYLGLTSRNLAQNQEFNEFFKNAILPNALCPKFTSCLLENPVSDYTPPSVGITHPSYPPTITSSKLIIEGVASDSNSGIANVAASISSFPIDRKNDHKIGLQFVDDTDNNSTRWRIPLIINESGAYRVVITATDHAGNTNHAETTINAAIDNNNSAMRIKEKSPKLAFVRPTFTEAAYQQQGFFDFYFKYGFPPFGKNITTDLDMLTVKTPRSVSEFPGNDIRHLSGISSLVPINGTELHDASQSFFPNPQKFWMPFITNVSKVAPNSTLTILRDEDIDDGNLFLPKSKTNAFDILFLFNNEYVTQQEYNNLKQFVINGGTIVFIDANVFRAEVTYDGNTGTITLVKGHDWKFDGKAATRNVPERWYNETKRWVGSNHLDVNTDVNFTNNPFNYTHFEEQFVNNPKDKIIMDYEIKFPKEFIELYLKKEKLPAELTREDIPIENITIATYSLQYGKGKVIMLGLTGRLLNNNESFMNFFDTRILPIAMCPQFQSCQSTLSLSSISKK